MESRIKRLSSRAQRSVDPSNAKRISKPPMVGVPDFLRWDSGPYSRINCCMRARLSAAMNGAPKSRHRANAVRNAPPERKVMY